jgi:hypothetical protein
MLSSGHLCGIAQNGWNVELRAHVDSELLSDIRSAVNKGLALGGIKGQVCKRGQVYKRCISFSISDNSPYRSEVYPEVFGDLLVRISACRIGRQDGRISIFRIAFNFSQWRWQWTALCEWNLHIIFASLGMRLHSLHKLLIPQKHLALDF